MSKATHLVIHALEHTETGKAISNSAIGAAGGTALLGAGAVGTVVGVPGATAVTGAGVALAKGAIVTASSIPVVGTAVASGISTVATSAIATGAVVGTVAVAAAPFVLIGACAYGLYKLFDN